MGLVPTKFHLKNLIGRPPHATQRGDVSLRELHRFCSFMLCFQKEKALSGVQTLPADQRLLPISEEPKPEYHKANEDCH